jgi:hypothetical protein
LAHFGAAHAHADLFSALITSVREKTTARAPVKKSSGILKISLERLGTSQDVEIVDDSATSVIQTFGFDWPTQWFAQ